MRFSNLLKENGWKEKVTDLKYTKGDWILIYDTSAWIEVGTKQTPRIFDVPVPEPEKELWTLNIIVHLCETDDKLCEMRCRR